MTLKLAAGVLVIVCAACQTSARDADDDVATVTTCKQGDTRECVGAGRCEGAQSCDEAGQWSSCDCGIGDPQSESQSEPQPRDAGLPAGPNASSDDPLTGPSSSPTDTPASLMTASTSNPGAVPSSAPDETSAPSLPGDAGSMTPSVPGPPLDVGPAPRMTADAGPISDTPTDFPSCDLVSYGPLDDTPSLEGVRGAWTYGDGSTTACTDFTNANMACLFGTAPPSGPDYALWGSGLVLDLVEQDEDGNALAPFDATALGVTGLRFTLTAVNGRAVRTQILQVNAGTIPYEANGFVLGGRTPISVDHDSTLTVAFADFQLPSWTAIPNGDGQVLDPTQIRSLAFDVTNDPQAATEPYSFCVSDLTWLDAAGVPVDVPE